VLTPAGLNRLLLTLLALACAAGTAWLGHWQLNRADEKLAQQRLIESQAALPALSASELPRTEAGPFLGRRVTLTGHWWHERTVYLDNRPMDGRVGFIVMTPLRLADQSLVLVQRGWLPRNFADRQALPDLPRPAGAVQVQGRLVAAPSRAYELGAEPGVSTIRQNLDPATYAREIGAPLLPVTVLQTDAAGDDLLRQWPAPDLGVSKHHGYAFQWFALCALISGLYVWFQFVRPRRARQP
jgi:surfeit locus 1 family protein